MSLIERSGDRLRIHPHPGQARAITAMDQARFVFIIAGTQSGKTSFMPVGLHRMISKRGAGDYLAVTATFDLFKLKFLPEMQHYFCDFLGWEWVASERLLYRKEDKSRIILRSASAEGGLESATVNGAILDECGQDDFRLNSWEAVQRRLSLSQGPVLAGTTPYNMGWLKTEIYDRWRAGDADYRVIQFKSTMNPAFPVAEYERAKRTLPAWKFEMFYNGQFTRPAGMIYEDFSEAENVVEDFIIPPEWPRYVGIDFGAVHTALVWLAHDPDKNIYYLYRESLQGNMTTAQHCQMALNLAKAENVVRWSGGAMSETQQRMDWRANGISIREPVISDVEAGIDRVNALIKPRTLKIFRSCKGTLDEIGTYARELDNLGQPTEKIKDKETFHRLDALRYAASTLQPEILIVDDPFAGW